MHITTGRYQLGKLPQEIARCPARFPSCLTKTSLTVEDAFMCGPTTVEVVVQG
jgi:hypothetical protein